MATVLVADLGETFPFAQLVKAAAQARHKVIEAYDAGQALQEVMRHQPDATIIPDKAESADGVELLPLLRRLASGVIIVVGDGQGVSTARALFLGADAYWKYPVDDTELRSRLRTLLRPRQVANKTNGSKNIDLMKREDIKAYTRGLTPVEMRLFQHLVKQGGSLVPAEQLASDVWGQGKKQDSLRFYIRRLRIKLEPQGLLRIVNHKGIGYRIVLTSGTLAR